MNAGQEQSFEASWSNAVFELYNVANTAEFQRLEQEAARRQLTKEAFATKMIEGEFRAAERTRAFYIHVFLPWAEEQHARTDPRLWFVTVRSGFGKDPLAREDERRTYWKHYEYYEHWYDRLLLCSLVNNGENEKAIELIAKMKEQATASVGNTAHYGCDLDNAIGGFRETIWLDSKLAEACYGRANAYRQRGEYDKAIADYTEAIRLAPTHAGAYYGRANAYQTKGDKAKADEDLAQAKRLGYTP